MMRLLKHLSWKKKPELAIIKELPKNSIVINSSFKTSKFLYENIKNMVIPASKSVDYLLLCATSIVFFNLVKIYFL